MRTRSISSRNPCALVYGPKYRAPSSRTTRVNTTRGNGSLVTFKYGKRLSSRSRTLNAGWWRLMRFASRISDSISFETTIVRTSTTRSTIFTVRYACAALS